MDLLRIGTDGITPNYLGGSTHDLDISSSPKQIKVRVTPGVNSTWSITGQVGRKCEVMVMGE